MRRWWALVAMAAVALAPGGCARPAGVDGDLTNGWPAFARAQTPIPDAGVCYPREYDPTWYGDFDSAVDCKSETHQTETVFVGDRLLVDRGSVELPSQSIPLQPRKPQKYWACALRARLLRPNVSGCVPLKPRYYRGTD